MSFQVGRAAQRAAGAPKTDHPPRTKLRSRGGRRRRQPRGPALVSGGPWRPRRGARLQEGGLLASALGLAAPPPAGTGPGSGGPRGTCTSQGSHRITPARPNAGSGIGPVQPLPPAPWEPASSELDTSPRPLRARLAGQSSRSGTNRRAGALLAPRSPPKPCFMPVSSGPGWATFRFLDRGGLSVDALPGHRVCGFEAQRRPPPSAHRRPQALLKRIPPSACVHPGNWSP